LAARAAVFRGGGAFFVATPRFAGARLVAFRTGVRFRAAARAGAFRFFDCFLDVRFAKSPPLTTCGRAGWLRAASTCKIGR
jgi:hypothetical protein